MIISELKHYQTILIYHRGDEGVLHVGATVETSLVLYFKYSHFGIPCFSKNVKTDFKMTYLTFITCLNVISPVCFR